MDLTDFQATLSEHLRTGGTSFLTDIPCGSGIIHLANVPHETWKPGFLSPNPGRWNLPEQPSKYFADDLTTCMAELGYWPEAKPYGRVVEVWETTKQFQVFDVTRLPGDLRQYLYEEKDPSRKWDASHVLVNCINGFDWADSVGGIYAPSASGLALNTGGMCLSTNPTFGNVKPITQHTFEEYDNFIQW